MNKPPAVTHNDVADNTNYYANLDPDKLVNAYGFGRFQWFAYILCECMNFFYSAAMYVMPYVELNPVIECTYKNVSIDVDESCRIAAVNNFSLEGVCGSVEGTYLTAHDAHSTTTLITEFDITCSSFFWKEAGLTAFTVGAIFFVPILSSLADWYGRRPLTVICLFTAFFSNLIASIAPNYYVFILFRLIVGASSDAYYSLCSILACELLPSESRAWISLVETIAWVLGMFWVGILSLFIHEWRLMYFACTAPGILAILYYFFLPESPYWSIQHMDYKRIEIYIKNANKWNNVAVDAKDCRRDGPPPVEKRETCDAILRSSAMLKLLFINGFIEFVMSFYYFGLSLLSVDLSDDRFTAYMLSALVELPGGLAVLPLMLYTGRRNLCMATLALQGLFVIIAPFLKHPHWFMVGCFLSGKFINSITYSVHSIYISEMAPTSVRSLSYSIINIPQSIGIIVAPYLRHVRIGPEYTKFVIVGILSLTAGALCLLLPETKDRPLPADISSLTAINEHTGDMKEGEELLRKRSVEEMSSTVSDEHLLHED
ncbi:hypothetical protein V3C99_015895 [Haemonchus contortus]